MSDKTPGIGATFTDAWLVEGVRTPFADYNGALAAISPTDLGIKVADVALEFWWGLFVPKGTPQPIKARLEKAIQDTMANPAVRERLIRVDTDPSFAPAASLRTKLENEIKNWSKFIDARGIKVEQ